MSIQSLRSNLLDEVADDIRFNIISRQVEDGLFLNEAKLSTQYSISRGSVRTVLSQLQQEGLVKTLSNGRKVVSGFTKDSLIDCWELRNFIECTAVKNILNNYKERVGEVSEIISKMCLDLPENQMLSGEIAIFADMNVHRLLVEASHSSILQNTWDNLSSVQETLLRVNINDWYKEEYISTIRDSHMPILVSILQKDEKAIDMLAEHISRGKDISVKALNKIYAGDIQ